MIILKIIVINIIIIIIRIIITSIIIRSHFGSRLNVAPWQLYSH